MKKKRNFLIFVLLSPLLVYGILKNIFYCAEHIKDDYAAVSSGEGLLSLEKLRASVKPEIVLLLENQIGPGSKCFFRTEAGDNEIQTEVYIASASYHFPFSSFRYLNPGEIKNCDFLIFNKSFEYFVKRDLKANCPENRFVKINETGRFCLYEIER
jgi:hypothetical protein